MIIKNKNIGSKFDDFMQMEGLLGVASATATKRVIAYQIQRLMREKHLTKKEMTSRMGIKNRLHLDRLLNPDNVSVTLLTLEKTANALGMKLVVKFI